MWPFSKQQAPDQSDKIIALIDERLDELQDLREDIAEAKKKHEFEIRKLNLDHELELKEKEFEMKHFKDEELQATRQLLDEANNKISVLETKNEMLEKIVDLNKDIIDVKQLVERLIEKLPNIDIKSLTVSNGANNDSK